MTPIGPPKAIRVKTSTGWVDLAIQGPTGPTGAQGPTGPTGPQGATGPAGPTGPDPAVIVDAKGDLLAGIADNVLARVPVGTNGQALIADSSSAPGVKWGNAGADLNYNGAYAGSTNYKDGDIVIAADGIAYMAVKPTTAPPKPWSTTQYPGKPTYGTTLPASPVDGQEAILVDSTTASTYQWRFRYNAQSTSAYKWEFVGGSSMRSGGGGGTLATTQTAPIDVPNGPVLALPRAGTYRFTFGASVYNAGTFAGAYATIMQVYNGATSLGNITELRHHSATYDGAAITGDGEATLAAAGSVNIKANLDRTGSNTTITVPWLELWPVKVA